jgi:hypothetical protein
MKTHSGSRCIPQLFLQPRSKSPGTEFTEECVGLGTVGKNVKNFAPTGFRTPNRPARSKSSYFMVHV